MNIKITSDSTCDLSKEILEKYGIGIVPLYVVKDGKHFRDGVDIFPEDIYAHVSAGGDLCGTAALSIGDYIEVFRPLSEKYDAVIHVNISAEFSSCHQNACLAAQEFKNVYVVDSRNLSSGQGHVALEAAQLAKEGKTPQEICESLKEFTERVNASFILNRLDYMRKGGRCSSVAALGANLLKLRPCIVVEDGKMHAEKKYRGTFETCVTEYIKDRLSVDYPIRQDRIFVTHSGVSPEVEAAAVKTVKSFGFENVYVTHAGCTVCGHCGENTIGVLYIKA